MQEDSFKKGITLIEVLASLFIIALVSTLAFVINRQTNRQFNLLRSANKLAQDIRIAQQMAMSVQECPQTNGCTDPYPYPPGPPCVPGQPSCDNNCGGCSGVSSGGYGILFIEDLSTYWLYANTYETPPQINTYDPEGGDAIIGTINLESGVSIQKLQTSTDGTIFDDVDYMSINFTPPDPTVTIKCGCAGERKYAIITFGLISNPAITKTIKVNESGLIWVE